MWSEARPFWRVPGVRRAEQRRGCGRHARVDRTAELPEEIDVDRAVGELGVQPTDHIPARARELEVDARPWRRQRGGYDHPGPRYAYAHLQAATFVRRSCRRCTHSGCCRQDRGRQEETLHGTLRNQSADNAPPNSRKAAEPPAKRSVTPRDSRR